MGTPAPASAELITDSTPTRDMSRTPATLIILHPSSLDRTSPGTSRVLHTRDDSLSVLPVKQKSIPGSTQHSSAVLHIENSPSISSIDIMSGPMGSACLKVPASPNRRTIF